MAYLLTVTYRLKAADILGVTDELKPYLEDADVLAYSVDEESA